MGVLGQLTEASLERGMSVVTEATTAPRVGLMRGTGHGLTLAGPNVRSLLRSPAALVDTIIQPVLFLVVLRWPGHGCRRHSQGRQERSPPPRP